MWGRTTGNSAELLPTLLTEPALIGAAIGVFGVFGAVLLANKLESDKELRRAKNLLIEDIFFVVDLLTVIMFTSGSKQLAEERADSEREAVMLDDVFFHCEKSCQRVIDEIRAHSHFLTKSGIENFRISRFNWEILSNYHRAGVINDELDIRGSFQEVFVLNSLSEMRQGLARVSDNLSGDPLDALYYEVFDDLSDPNFTDSYNRLQAAMKNRAGAGSRDGETE
jgi:hypothetical protein